MLKLHTPETEDGWELLAARIIKANMVLAGMTIADLSERLRQLGLHQSEDAIRLKLHRRTCSATFFLQAMSAIGVEKITLPKAQVLDP